MDVKYTWILRHWKNCRQFRLLFSLSFYISSGGGGEKGWRWGVVGKVIILARYKFHLIRVHDIQV